MNKFLADNPFILNLLSVNSNLIPHQEIFILLLTLFPDILLVLPLSTTRHLQNDKTDILLLPFLYYSLDKSLAFHAFFQLS